MSQFEIWKLATDALLILSIVYLSVRFLRASGPAVNTREMRDLEIVLKTLIKDADVAGRALGESLTRRQHSLENLLSEIDSAERRVSRSMAQPNSIELNRESSREIPREMSREMPREVMREISREPAYASQPVREPTPIIPQRNPVPALEEEPIAPRRTGAAAYTAPQQAQPSQPKPRTPELRSNPARTQSRTKYNIFGEPLGGEAPSRVMPDRLPEQRIARNIEVEHTPAPVAPPSAKSLAELDQVYESAERMLRAGKKLDSVSEETSLPVEEVRAISKMMEREIEASPASSKMPQGSMEVFKPQRVSADELEGKVDVEVGGESAESAAASDQDPRLGVLGTMRREIQVL